MENQYNAKVVFLSHLKILKDNILLFIKIYISANQNNFKVNNFKIICFKILIKKIDTTWIPNFH